MEDFIKIKNASENNLKGVDLEIPKNQLIVFTGVSGSGKSSLAFDTIFAEGQRRYVESLSTYARQFLGQLDKPKVDYIDGLSPAIAIDQKSTSNNPRSTVGTVTEIYDYLRLLYARVGTPYCPECGTLIQPQSVDEIVDKVMKLPMSSKIQILAPIVRGKKGEYSSLLREFRDEGFIRVEIDGKIYNLDEDEIELAKTLKHNISLVIDRIVIKENIQSRLSEAVQTALQKADGLIEVKVGTDGEQTLLFSEKLACPNCNSSFEELAPRIFSFNLPYGACPSCNGLGFHFEVNVDLLVPDKKKSLKEGAIYPWNKGGKAYYQDILACVAKHYGFSMDTPFEELSDEAKNIILYGSKSERIRLRYPNFLGTGYDTRITPFSGVVNYYKKKYDNASSDEAREEVLPYMSMIPCKTCGGARLKPFALAVKINDVNIYDFCKMSITNAHKFITRLYLELDDYKMSVAKQILDEIKARLSFMIEVGLGYLDLARMASTLSGGEAQRIRLATQIGSGLSGVLYVLDEPSIGLHQRDNDRLISTLFKLRNLGNTLIVVEHDEDTIRSADYIVDIGPKAGIYGGEIIAKGQVEDIQKAKKSITGKYLKGELEIPAPSTLREGNGQFLEVKNAYLNNLKNIDVKIPLGKIVGITGVSGSGKSTLMNDLIHQYSKFIFSKNLPKPQGVDEILGFENIDKVIDIDQSPIGRTPRSNPATYTGVFDHIRALFAMTNEAKARGYKQGRFSFNTKGGRCEACSGDGYKKIEMNFLSDVYVKCAVCQGKRYNRETLEVKYKGKDISDVLDMSVGEALEFFSNIPKIKRRLQTLYDVGLDYIKLGQSATTLSGGEAQRIKLAAELNKISTGKTLYLLDEPSVGLHWWDLDKLAKILNKLADAGNTILIIEHNLDLIKICDHIIDLGPEGGDGGGTIIYNGARDGIMSCEQSYTGQYLKRFFDK